MLVFVYGGAASGKSEYAEAVAVTLAGSSLPLFYTATLDPADAECIEKINRHRALRKGKHFVTLECPRGLSRLRLPGCGVVLLECLSTLTANELFSGTGDPTQVSAWILRGIDHMLAASKHVVVVSNALFADGREYDPFTRQYLQTLGSLHQQLAQRAGLVVEVVAGLPVIWKNSHEEVSP